MSNLHYYSAYIPIIGIFWTLSDVEAGGCIRDSSVHFWLTAVIQAISIAVPIIITA